MAYWTILAEYRPFDDLELLAVYSIGILTVVWYLVGAAWYQLFALKAPLARSHHFWELPLVLGLRFSRHSGHLLREGYRKVCCN